MTIDRVDHLVLTVADVDRTVDFYRRTLGMRRVAFGVGRVSLAFGAQKITLHRAGHEVEPKTTHPAPGSADLCLTAAVPLAQVGLRLEGHGVSFDVGPVPRTGATGPLTSLHFRDPDGNLVEVRTSAAPLGPAEVVRRYWEGIQARDWAGIADLLAPDVVIEWPVSGERIRGHANLVAVNAEHPRGRSIRALQIIASGERVVSEMEVPFEGAGAFRVVSFWTVREGMIVAGREYWTTLGDPAPDWRAPYVERI